MRDISRYSLRTGLHHHIPQTKTTKRRHLNPANDDKMQTENVVAVSRLPKS